MSAALVPLTAVTAERQAEWDRFVERSPQAHYRQTTRWLWLTSAARFLPLLLTVHDQDGGLRGGAAVLKLVVPGLNRSILLVPYGPVTNGDAATLADVCAALCRLAPSERAVFLRVTPYAAADDTAVATVLHDHGFRHRPERWSFLAPAVDLMCIDLRPPLDALMAAFPSETRYKIRHAARAGAAIDTSGSPDAVARLCRLLRSTADRKAFSWLSNDTPQHCAGLLSRFGEQARIAVVSRDGGDIAAGVFLALGGTCWYLYGGTERASRIQAARLLHWDVIAWARSRGCSRYDMLGGVTFPADASQPGHGTYLFKQSLNARETRLTGYWDCVFSPPLYAALGVAERKLFPRIYRWLPRLAGRGR